MLARAAASRRVTTALSTGLQASVRASAASSSSPALTLRCAPARQGRGRRMLVVVVHHRGRPRSAAAACRRRGRCRHVGARRPVGLGHQRRRRQIGDDRAAEARALERAQLQPAVADEEAHAPVVLVIEVGVRLQERQALALRPAGEAVDEVVAVALDVGQAEQRDQRQVLLHRKAGLRRQVLAREEVARRRRLRRSRGGSAPG